MTIQDLAYPSQVADSALDALRVPPHSIEAEQSVLGGLMIDNPAWDQVADLIGEDDFYRRDHRLIFRAIATLADESSPYDVVTLSEWLEKHRELENAGGMSYLASLAKNTPTAANIKAYANIVRERSVLRQLIRVASEIGDSAHNPEGKKSADLLDMAEAKVFEIAEKGARGKSGYTGIKDLLVKAVDRIDTLYQNPQAFTGVPTGWNDFDEMTSGLQNSDLIIIAGRPSMGKTSFAMNIVENAAIKSKVPVAVFSMEMPGEQLVMRMMSSLGRIDQHKIRTGKLDDTDWPRMTSAVNLLSEAPIYIDDTPGLNPIEVRSRARRIKREHGLGLIVLDYLQLMQTSGSSENRATEISEISRALKGLAKELNVPVIALSQLNRSLEQRPNKRPIMSDLRESGAIEQDADVITFIYRDEVYNEESPDKGTAEIIIGKQRNGPIGTARLTFLGKYTRFENFVSNNYDEGYGGGPE
ncbi:MAG: replicative DNA helicase [Thioalkalispiraceae bacterium]|jgi:replicative DNA helicase